MQDSYLINILSTLSKREMRDLGRFLESPLHCKRKDVRKLYSILSVHHPDFDGRKLNAESIYSKMYPGKKFSGGVLRKISSELFKACEEYLKFKLCISQPEAELELFNEYIRKDTDRLVEKKQKEIEGAFVKTLKPDQNYLLLRSRFEMSMINFHLRRGEQEKAIPRINDQAKYLINYFLIRILNIAHDKEVNRNLFNAEYGTDYTEEFLHRFNVRKFIEESNIEESTFELITRIFFHLYYAYLEFENDADYQKSSELFFGNLSRISANDKLNIFLLLENCCTRRIINGREEYLSVVFGLYKKILKDIYSSGRKIKMDVDLFRNIIITGLKLKEYVWVKKFIEKYVNWTDAKFRTSMQNYAMSRLLLETGKHEEALTYLSKVKYEYFLFKNDVRNMLLRIYFELDHYEDAVAVVDSYRHFLSGNKNITELNRRSNLKFIRLYLALFRLKKGIGRSDLSTISSDLSKARYVTNKQWLEEKVVELKSRMK